MQSKYKVGDIVEIAKMPKYLTSSDYPYGFVCEMREEAGKKVQIIRVEETPYPQPHRCMYTEPYHYICDIVKGEEYNLKRFVNFLPNYKWVETEFVQRFYNGLPIISIF